MMAPLRTALSRIVTATLLAITLGACHELGNPVTRVTPPTPFPAEAPHTTLTHLTYAHSSEAVAWRRPPAHALDRDLPRARYIARIDVDHGQVANAGVRVGLATTVVFVDGRTRTVQWVAPTAESPWSLDLALASPPARALTRVVAR